MAYNTNFINIFEACVDNVNKKIYNNKCKLYNFGVCVLLALAVAMALLGSVIKCGASDEQDKDRLASVKLAGLSHEDERIKFNLIADSAKPICGMQVIIRCNADMIRSVEVLPAQALTEQGGVVSFEYGEGEIAIIVDFCENYFGGEIAEISIAISEDFFGRSVCFETQVISLYFWSDDRLFAAALPEKEELWVTIPSLSADNSSFYATAEAESRAGEVSLTMSAVAEAGCFAAGFEVYAVELDGFGSQCFSVLSVLGGDASADRAFSHTAILSGEKRYCVIIKPVAYFGSRAMSGGETVIIIDNGEVRG